MAIGADGRASRGSRLAPALVALAALSVAIGAVIVEARSPDKGFVAFVGRRVVSVTEGSEVAAAGIRPGDRVVAVDGREVRSILDYARDVLRRDVGEVVTISFDTQRGPRDVAIRLVQTPTPWMGIAAVGLAAILLALGLVALRSEDTVAAQRFFRTTVIFALLYGGALYWNHLVPYPWLAAGPLLALVVCPGIVLDFLLGFPARAGGVAVRRAAWLAGVVIMSGAGASLVLARLEEGPAVEAHVARAVAFVGAQLVLVLACFVIGVIAQARALRASRGETRAQRKWLLLGFAACVVPFVLAIPVALDDYDAFLLGGHRPFLIALMVLWFAAAALAVLRVRLADVDAVIHRSATYAIALGAAAIVYFGLALALGLALERVIPDAPWASHLFAAGLAAFFFGPIHRRVGGWIERRFFRDRLHYLAALRALDDALLEVRELEALAREVVERSVAAVRARGGALYLADGDALRLAHAIGDAAPALSFAEALAPAEDGVAILVEGEGQRQGVLRLEARLAGDLYSSEDRDLLETLAGRLAAALASSRAYTTIAELGRTLEAQNAEIRALRDKLEDENRYLKGRLDAADSERRLVGRSRATVALEKQILKLAPGAATVLIRGESGTGKSLVARALHDASDRADGPFVHVDCASFAKGVIESELFGHERGAFTGADRLRRGCFELADGGTLFLDEIGELPLELQPKLLRVLQERSFTRLGGTAPVTVDLRVVAATHRDLEGMIERGELRKDLYYRLSVVALEVPPLRERRADVADLVEAMMPALCRKNHRRPRPLSEEAMTALTTYDWPGNVRELSNVLERAVVLAEGDVIEKADLALREAPVRREPVPPSVPPPPSHREEMERVEREHLARSLAEHGGNKSAAAIALGMPRTTLISKLRKHGLV